jgi:hypothetical protein
MERFAATGRKRSFRGCSSRGPQQRTPGWMVGSRRQIEGRGADDRRYREKFQEGFRRCWGPHLWRTDPPGHERSTEDQTMRIRRGGRWALGTPEGEV